MHARINHHDVIELIRQILFGRFAQMIDRLAHCPMFGGHHDLALHQTTSGIFRIGQRLFNRRAVDIFQRAQNRFGLRVFKVLDQVNNIIAVHVAHSIRQDLRRQDRDDFLADGFIKFRQDFPVKLAVI